jgi:hydroxylaminobenzene mutase
MEMQIARHLKMMGMVLFMLGLITGLMLGVLKNPRMGLSAHLEGVMNGTFLVVAGLVWKDLKLGPRMMKVLLWLLVLGTYVNWLATLLAAMLGTSKMTPIAGSGYEGTPFHESLVSAGLAATGLLMLISLVLLVYGLRGKFNSDLQA